MQTKNEKGIVVDNYHGTLVEDPFRWLEDDKSIETKNWEDNQNKQTHAYFSKIQNRVTIKDKLMEHWNYEKYFIPQKEGSYYYYHKNDGLQNQPVFYRAHALTDATPEVIIDPNALNSDGTTALTNISFNKEGTLMAYAISENGSDWQEIKIRNMESGFEYPEIINRCKFSSLAWIENGTGFYYSRFPDQGTVELVDESNYNRLYFHIVNTPQSEDKLIHERPDDKELAFRPIVSDDYKYLLLESWKGTENKSRLYYRAIESDDAFIPLADAGDANYSFIGNNGTTFYIYTNKDAPNGKIVAINLNEPQMNQWKETIPEQQDVMSFIKLIDDQIAITYMHHAKDQIKLYDLDGVFDRILDLPDMITVTNISTNKKEKEMFISYTSYLTPTTVVRYDFHTKSLDTVFSSKVSLDSSRFETTQVFYPSTDGTNIPMFITHKKGIQLTADHPVLLYGYGGFNISMTPSYSASNAMFIEDGGIYAVANIRGGGEYGEDWHQAGTFERKQQVFDDFIAAAEWLISSDYTNSSKLAIMGGSNGGLLVSACMNQRPELYNAVICQVPVTDMLRYQHFTVGRFWTSEFGNAEENAEHFKTIYAYSPLHNISPNRNYPATLITTADTDDRVVPLHAKKYAATLQEAKIGEAPILLRIEKDAGHGLGKPTSKIIEEHTDIYTFIYKFLGMN
ncbi:prolyl oligopeptidase family protein [Psychrobacillus sp. OK032]|uniref:prolyl oligopeptidase family serine peptidase n=1 Tax=Psychrobacillus sp. OK032 TaxID=1884358 RepID=UPI0008C084CC|nr:prolyl oligopeptidase family serine peptidase [Psychrobacillus sp. OK032]SES19042.1 prolyl oligopeptidase Serine peptidase. MEROPS family S09A [Psychrobacillus sp. OK032]